MRRFVCAIGATLVLCFLSGLAEAETKTFNDPKIGPNRLDWCVNWGTGCGEPAATAWCKTNEFDHSVDSKQAVDIGAATPTKLIATGEVCDQAYCDGFASITCATAELPATPPPAPEPSEADAPTPLPQVAETANETFKNPMHEGVRLNWCFSVTSGCGKKAAEAWCAQQGYSTAKDWHVSGVKPTIEIGTGKTTKGSQRLQPRYLREVNQLPYSATV
jgi:hypothetical protein